MRDQFLNQFQDSLFLDRDFEGSRGLFDDRWGFTPALFLYQVGFLILVTFYDHGQAFGNHFLFFRRLHFFDELLSFHDQPLFFIKIKKTLYQKSKENQEKTPTHFQHPL